MQQGGPGINVQAASSDRGQGSESEKQSSLKMIVLYPTTSRKMTFAVLQARHAGCQMCWAP